MKQIIRIGTRDSELALWQAKTVQQQLENLHYNTEIIPIKSGGDLNLKTPLYEMGIVGIFTKALDIALLQQKIDIAVHSMKDVPTVLPKEIIQAAVLKRGASADILVYNDSLDFQKECTIATSSLRRKAQWLHAYPHHKVVPLRGNVNTRLRKLKTENWDGAIFAKAGLKRINILPKNYLELEDMIPAPAQGAVVISSLAQNDFARSAATQLNHENTHRCTYAERLFLRELEGGCLAPIGATARIENEQIHFRGNLLSLDGKKVLTVEKYAPAEKYKEIGKTAAEEILNQGGLEMMKEIRKVTDRTKK